jgi:hypothetical protein
LTDIYHYDLIVPEVMLDLQGKKIVDGTPQCKEYFDRRIAATKAQLPTRHILRFKNHSIRDDFEAGRVKGDILGIVFSYLYTGREAAAKRALYEMWPADEVDEIWGWMTKKRSEGVLRQASARGLQ